MPVWVIWVWVIRDTADRRCPFCRGNPDTRAEQVLGEQEGKAVGKAAQPVILPKKVG
jgi:hypothetical protein